VLLVSWLLAILRGLRLFLRGGRDEQREGDGELEHRVLPNRFRGDCSTRFSGRFHI
jgi:hypothetical protein